MRLQACSLSPAAAPVTSIPRTPSKNPGAQTITKSEKPASKNSCRKPRPCSGAPIVGTFWLPRINCLPSESESRGVQLHPIHRGEPIPREGTVQNSPSTPFFRIAGSEPRVSCVLDKCSVLELCAQPFPHIFTLKNVKPVGILGQRSSVQTHFHLQLLTRSTLPSSALSSSLTGDASPSLPPQPRPPACLAFRTTSSPL